MTFLVATIIVYLVGLDILFAIKDSNLYVQSLSQGFTTSQVGRKKVTLKRDVLPF